MSQPPAPRATYTIEFSETELTRLEYMAEANAAYVRDGCRRVGLQAGAAAIDVGCGAPGALLPLADVVGSHGTVVGIDVNAATVAQAQEIIKRHQAPHVSVIQADINTLNPAAICPPGGFDLAYCHHVLFHQADPVVTLRRMAALVRSGGHLLIQEIVLDARCAEPPLVDPASPALQQWHNVTAAVIRRAGGHPEIAQYLDETMTAAGVQPLRQYAYASGGRPADVATSTFQGARDTLESMRQAIVTYAVATDADVDALLHDLATEAQSMTFRTFLSSLYVEGIARVP